jgi:molybdate transport system ATP-binding protein
MRSATVEDCSTTDESRGLTIAAIRHSGEQEIDRLISGLAFHLKHKGYRVGGVVQANDTALKDHRCDMRLVELKTGKVYPISQQLGPGAAGCRLDVSALGKVVAQVEATLGDELDILVLNKFGKQEAEGGGLRDAIADAAQRGIPVIVGLNQAYESDWSQFCGGEGHTLDADSAVLATAEHA